MRGCRGAGGARWPSVASDSSTTVINEPDPFRYSDYQREPVMQSMVGKSHRVAAGKHSSRLNSFIAVLGLLLFPLAWLAVKAQSIPVVGILSSLLAPNLVLLGLGMISWVLAAAVSHRLWLQLILFIGFTLLFGLNTRVPSVIADAATHWYTLRVQQHLPDNDTQPIRLIASVPIVSARGSSYDSAQPSCVQREGCFFFDGYQTPAHGSYWGENVLAAVTDAGFVQAEPAQRAPTMTVSQATSGRFSTVHIALMDARGRPIADFRGRYRAGFPYETPDNHLVGVRSNQMEFEYLLHGNLLNKLVGRFVAPVLENPVRAFLAEVKTKPGPPPQAEVELIETHLFDPPRLIESDGVRMDPAFDRVGEYRLAKERCKPFLADTQPSSDWQTFVQDTTARKRIRTNYGGNAICMPQGIWIVSRGSGHARLVLTKYTLAGERAYQVEFQKPSGSDYEGSIVKTTFRANNGYLEFGWRRMKQSGGKMFIAENSKVRLREPVPQSPD